MHSKIAYNVQIVQRSGKRGLKSINTNKYLKLPERTKESKTHITHDARHFILYQHSLHNSFWFYKIVQFQQHLVELQLLDKSDIFNQMFVFVCSVLKCLPKGSSSFRKCVWGGGNYKDLTGREDGI